MKIYDKGLIIGVKRNLIKKQKKHKEKIKKIQDQIDDIIKKYDDGQIELNFTRNLKQKTPIEKIEIMFKNMTSLLKYKDEKYGNAVLTPIEIFSKHLSDKNSIARNGIFISLDHKLSRIKNSETLRKNDLADLLGYLSFLMVDLGYLEFDEFKD